MVFSIGLGHGHGHDFKSWLMRDVEGTGDDWWTDWILVMVAVVEAMVGSTRRDIVLHTKIHRFFVLLFFICIIFLSGWRYFFLQDIGWRLKIGNLLVFEGVWDFNISILLIIFYLNGRMSLVVMFRWTLNTLLFGWLLFFLK